MKNLPIAFEVFGECPLGLWFFAWGSEVLHMLLEGGGDQGVEAHDARVREGELLDERRFDGANRSVLGHELGVDGLELFLAFAGIVNLVA